MSQLHKFKEEKAAAIDESVRNAWDALLDKYSPKSTEKMVHEKIHDYEGGTDLFFDQVYINLYKNAEFRDLWGKDDEKSVASKLEFLVREAMKISNMGNVYLELYDAMVTDKEFKSDREKIQHLEMLARNYLGASEEDWNALQQSARSGDKLMFKQSMREFLNGIKTGYIGALQRMDITDKIKARDHPLFAAYMTKRMEGLGYEAKELGAELMAPPQRHIGVHNALKQAEYQQEKRMVGTGYKPKH